MIIFSSFIFKTFILALVTPVFIFILLNLFLKIFFLKNILSQNKITAISAGLLMSLIFIDFLPHSFERSTPLSFAITGIITLVILLMIETQLIPRLNILNQFFPLSATKHNCSHIHQHHHHPFSHQGSFSAIGCLLVCAFFDGLRLASSLLVEASAFGVTGLALFLHIFPEAILVMSLVQKSNLSKKQSRMIQMIFCLFFGQGILLAGLFEVGLSEGVILSLSTVTFIYTLFIHLLPQAFLNGNRKWFLISLVGSSVFLFLSHLNF